MAMHRERNAAAPRISPYENRWCVVGVDTRTPDAFPNLKRMQHSYALLCDEILEERTQHLSFEYAYRTAYNLKIYGGAKGANWMRQHTRTALRRLNLYPYDDALYTKLSKIFVDVAMITRAMPSDGELALDDEAKRLRTVEGLCLWRNAMPKLWRVVHIIAWERKIRAWLVAFNRVAFVPDSVCAHRVADEFYEIAHCKKR